MSESGAVTVVPAESNLPAQRPVGFLPTNLTEAMHLANVMSKSGLMPTALRGKPHDVLLVLMKGQELGLAPMQAVSSISVIAGKAVCEAALMVALCVSRPEVCEYFQLIESTIKRATYETKRRGAPAATRLTYTIEEAAAAGLTGKDNWKHHPAAMLRARASGALVRAVYADLAMGIYVRDDEEHEILIDNPPPISMPRAIGESAPTESDIDVTAAAESVPDDPSDLGSELTEPDEPVLTDGPAIQTWTGQILRITKTDAADGKWTLWRLYGADGRIFGTFSSTLQAVAVAHGRKAGVTITYKHTDKGDTVDTIEPVTA